MKRMEVYFDGDVQGVGFRFTARRVAEGFPITGEIRNLPDGRVELIAEGEENDLRRYLANLLLSRLAPGITHHTVRFLPARHTFPAFHIR